MNFDEFLFSHFIYKMIAEQPKTHLEPRLTAFYRGQTRLTKTTHRLITFCYELMIRVLTGNDSLFMNFMILLTRVHIRVQNFSLVGNTWDCFTFELMLICCTQNCANAVLKSYIPHNMQSYMNPRFDPIAGILCHFFFSNICLLIGRSNF